jgi:hypothetical protein
MRGTMIIDFLSLWGRGDRDVHVDRNVLCSQSNLLKEQQNQRTDLAIL